MNKNFTPATATDARSLIVFLYENPEAARLTPREERVLFLRYAKNGDKVRTLEEVSKIGISFGVTRLIGDTSKRLTGERIRGIETKAFRKLRSRLQ